MPPDLSPTTHPLETFAEHEFKDSIWFAHANTRRLAAAWQTSPPTPLGRPQPAVRRRVGGGVGDTFQSKVTTNDTNLIAPSSIKARASNGSSLKNRYEYPTQGALAQNSAFR